MTHVLYNSFISDMCSFCSSELIEALYVYGRVCHLFNIELNSDLIFSIQSCLFVICRWKWMGNEIRNPVFTKVSWTPLCNYNNSLFLLSSIQENGQGWNVAILDRHAFKTAFNSVHKKVIDISDSLNLRRLG